MDKLAVNHFTGRDTDSNHSLVSPDKYIEAHNIELVGDSSFYAIRNIAGTTQVQELVADSNAKLLAAYPAKVLISGTSYDCIITFTCVPSSTFNIKAYNVETDTLYELYEESIDADYYTEDRVIDAASYPENGVDFIYFTDNFREVRFIKCEIPDPYSPNFLSSYDISLQRRGANGTIDYSVAAGGSLLTGTYQFSYRMADPENKRFTKWSTLTNPIHVYTSANTSSGSSVPNSGIGLQSSRKITLSIAPSAEELDNFDYVQLAVVENTGPTVSDINGVTSALPDKASLLEITAISGSTLSFEYKSNTRIGSIPINDIVVDLAQIERVKTLAVKENRLFAGNISYSNLEFDNGDPEITSGSIATQTSSEKDCYSSDDFASKYVSYWRGEVYRFGIVYYDEYGNRSPVKHLDLSGVTGNQISGALDMKFPTRATSNSYALFNSSNEIRALGLQLNGIINHPTWARSFEIVRVKRKKDILFQTPVVPMSTVEGAGALSDYPSRYFTDAFEYSTVTDAQPMTASTVLVPKNFFWPELRQIVKNNEVGLNSGEAYISTNEVKLERDNDFSFASIFPSPSMYGDTPFVFTGAEKVDVIDYALLKANAEEFYNSPTYLTGDHIKTSIAGNFYALNEGQYYFDSTWTGKSISSSLTNISIVDYEFFDNFGQPASVGGNSTLDYEALQTKGISFWQNQPSVNRMGVVQLGTTLTDNPSTVFKAGTLNAVNDGNYIIGSSGVRYETDAAISNKYINEYASFTNKSSYISGLAIANVKLGLGDDRYGDPNSFHEYISTGAKYTFDESEVTTLQGGGSVSVDITVWGGDCFIGPQLFKVCDSTYSVTNQQKNTLSTGYNNENDMAKRWGNTYRYDQDGSNPTMCLPVAVKNSGQYIQVILESEYNGEVRDKDIIPVESFDSNMPIYLNSTEASIRTPLTYNYNLNLSKQNDRKVFVPKPTYSFEQYEFGARMVYSDLKIYNSDQAGFDIFRVANIHDLEESRRSITKLAVAGDNLYAIQEQGVVYIPTGERQIESTDGGTLSIKSGEVIGRPLIIDSKRGCQHLRAVVSTGGVIYFPDNINKSVYALAGNELKPITQNNESQFRSFFWNFIDSNAVVGLFDPIKKEYWLIKSDAVEVFNEDKGWVGTLDFTNLMGGASVNQKLYVIGRPSSSLAIHEMYTGDVNQLFGVSVTPSVTFVVNPDEFSKTFNVIQIASTSALSTMDFVTEGSTSQTVTGTSVDPNVNTNVREREAKFVFATPRGSGDKRLSGLRMKVTAKFKATQATLSSIITNYRNSARRSF